MSRSPKTASASDAAAQTQAAEQVAPAILSLADAPAVAALVALIGAISALAGFPSTPVQESLVRNVSTARQAFLEAVSAPIELPALGDGSSVYDDAWIKTTFEDLNATLKARFEGLDALVLALSERLDAAITTSNDRLAETVTNVALADLAERVAALEAAAAPAEDQNA